MSASDGSRLGLARTYIDQANDYGGFGQTFVNGVGAIVLAIFSGTMAVWFAITGAITNPLDALGTGSADLVESTTSGPARFLLDAWEEGGRVLQTDPWNTFGPFLPLLAVAIGLAAVAMVGWYLDRNDSDLLGLGVDLPIIGNDEDDEEDG